jgi:hypothetical protein
MAATLVDLPHRTSTMIGDLDGATTALALVTILAVLSQVSITTQSITRLRRWTIMIAQLLSQRKV